MFLLQMFLEGLSSIGCLGARTAFGFLFIATPGLEMVMLGILVSFPVVLATEDFVAGSECTAIRPLVTLHVLLQFARATRKLLALLTGDLVFTPMAGSRSEILGSLGMTWILGNNVTQSLECFQDLNGFLFLFLFLFLRTYGIISKVRLWGHCRI
jgi:hypothetical protein